MSENPKLSTVLAWLLSITAPVHGPLMISLACRVLNLIVDFALFGVAAGFVVSAISDDVSVGKFALALVGLALVKAGLYYVEQFTGHYVAFKALELLRTQVFAALMPRAPGIVSHSRSGDILASLTRDVDRIEVVYAHTFAPVASAYIVGFGATIVGGFALGWQYIWVAAGCLAFSLFVVPILGWRSSMNATQKTMELRRDLAHHVTDSVFGVDEVIGYALQRERQSELDDLGTQIARVANRSRIWVAVRRTANLAASLAATASIIYLGQGQLPVEVLAAAALVSLRVFEAPRGIEDAAGYLDHSLSAARRLYEISHVPPQVNDGCDTLAIAVGPAVEFSSVSYTYPTRDGSPLTPAVSDITWRIPAGGYGVLVGRSGSGKSTLVQLLQRYDDPSAGEILLNGVSIAQYTLDSLRSAVVAVTQRNQLINGTIAENLRLGAPEATDAELWAALAVAELDADIQSFPDKLATHAGKGRETLSGGQVQRLCLARALLIRPTVLILDEFTANLGLKQAQRIRENLATFVADMTVIEVTHRLEAIGDADTVAVIDRGRLLSCGSPQELPEARIQQFLGGLSDRS